MPATTMKFGPPQAPGGRLVQIPVLVLRRRANFCEGRPWLTLRSFRDAGHYHREDGGDW
jgi:hypothetical protein